MLIVSINQSTVATHFLQILEYVPSDYTKFAKACVDSFLAYQGPVRTKDLTILLRAMFVLNVDVRPHEERLLEVSREARSTTQARGRDRILSATILARKGIFDRESIRSVIDEANASPKLREATTRAELAEGAFEMWRRHSVRGYTYTPKDRHLLEWDLSRSLSELEISLANVAELSMLADFSLGDESLPRLHPDLWDKLAGMFVREPDDNRHAQRRLAVLQTLRELFGPHMLHGLSHPLASFPDIVCCLRKTRSGIVALPLPAQFTAGRLAREFVRPPPVRNGTWKVLTVPNLSRAECNTPKRGYTKQISFPLQVRLRVDEEVGRGRGREDAGAREHEGAPPGDAGLQSDLAVLRRRSEDGVARKSRGGRTPAVQRPAEGGSALPEGESPAENARSELGGGRLSFYSNSLRARLRL